MSKGWDNATLKKLKALTGKGLSTSEIGKRLGMSKNAVVGKLNRLGWNLKAGGVATAKNDKTGKKTETKKDSDKISAKSSTTAKSTAKVVKKTELKKKSEIKVLGKTTASKKEKDVKESKSLNKNLAMHQRIIQHSLEMANLKPNQCRWPIGDPDSENFHFCGEPVFVGKPYCYEHCKQAYQFTPPKKK